MAKELAELYWVEEKLPKNHTKKPMFGGFGYYIGTRMVLALFESTGDKSDRTYKDKTFDYEIWNGCLFPADYEKHEQIKKQFPYLVNHPVLNKWFYLPLETENFEDLAEEILKQIKKNSPLFGTIPKEKRSKSIKTKTDKKFEKIDTRTPKMFRDEPAENVIHKAKNISDLKNLGPTMEANMKKAGIKTAAQLIKLGWKKSYAKLVKASPKNRHSLVAYALIGALKNLEFNAISEEDKLEAREFSASLKSKKSKK